MKASKLFLVSILVFSQFLQSQAHKRSGFKLEQSGMTMENVGMMFLPEYISADKIEGDGCLVGDKVVFKVNEFLFNGTFVCNQKCDIYTFTLPAAIHMIHKGKGKITIHPLQE